MILHILLLSPFLTIALMSLSKKIKTKAKKEREKMTPFECGFDPSHQMRSSFSLRFFVTTLLFLVFDVETAVLLPLPLGVSSSNNSYLVSLMSLIFLLLLMGLVLEWSQGALDWLWNCI
uniref:NADH-ubiquinone oxidoreductase chain 3 n=1 Tax=Pseudobiotus spinifer TaxID=1477120 RepID=A0A0K0KA08_9BILA|nr:NADH dehydogenase subunit 3 [Pseudobiotus spinifer]